jgi:catechol 2,3-dioxygenase-like lactoylglutathione lyase family enzyme
MIKVNEVAFVAYPVKDKQRARDFYEGVLGLEQSSGGDFHDNLFWYEYELGPHTIALSNFWQAPAGSAQTGPSAGLEVEDFDATIAELKKRNVPFTTEPMETAVCNLAVVLDPDGNSLFIHKRKPGRD